METEKQNGWSSEDLFLQYLKNIQPKVNNDSPDVNHMKCFKWHPEKSLEVVAHSVN